MQTCESLVNRLLPCRSYGSFEIFKISASEFGTVSMRRSFRACAYEFLNTVTEGVVHSVHKVVIRSSFGVMWQHKASGGTWTFCHCDTRVHTNLGWYLKDRGVSPNAYNRKLHRL